MKKGLFLLLTMTLGYLSMAQVPNSFSYQMVIRNGNNELVANTTVGIRIGLLGGNAADTVWYEEEHKVKTNLNGLAYITIGKGNMLKGTISTIDWTRGPFFIKSETDPTGGTNYSLIIVSQMLSVPYAIYAKTAEKLSTPVTESDPLFNKSIAKGITAEDTARWSKREVYDGNSGGGVVFETDPVYNASVAKGIRSVDTAAWNNKLNLRDTMNLLRPYLRSADTASLSNRLNQKVDLNQLNSNTLTLDGKINIADTAGMLANYRMGISSKVNIADTLNMLIPYLRDADTSSMLANYRTGLNTKVNIADTSAMLANYRTVINAKVNISDTLNMLTPYLKHADTTALLANYRMGIASKVNISDTTNMLLPYLRGADTSSMLQTYLRDADTTSMLLPYLWDADTTSMLQPYLRDADTTSMLLPYLRAMDSTAMLANYRTGISTKVNILDTASMLQPYLRDADTTSMLLPYLRAMDSTAMLANYRTGISTKVNILDTASMLQPYLRDADTTSMLLPYLRDADTTAMLASYRAGINTKVNILDTASMLQPYLRDVDTTSMLSPYLRDADTTAMLTNYRTGINAKVNILDTASMLEPYLREPDGPVPGDILYYNINNKWARLPTGQDGQFLMLSSGMPTWTSTAPGSPTGVSASAGNGQATVSFTAPANTGGSPITGYTVTSSPAGGTATGTNLSLSVTGLINGTSYTFTVVATNAMGNSAASLASTSVTPCINTANIASSTPSLCINTTLTNITHSTTGATGIGTATGLPNGVTAAWASNTITISGTPNASGTFNYSIPLTGGCGSVNATGTITVSENIAGTASNTPTICVNTILTDITHSTTGATGIGTPTGLPTGVTAAWASNTITISGTPNASGTFNYSIPLTGGCGSVNATGTITVACIPTVTTTAISSITTTGASSGGNITDEGGLSVTVRGVVYSTSSNPTISNSTTSNGTGTGSFTSTLASLTGATTYYVRAYATNSVGTAYGNELTFTTSAPIPTSALICSTAPGGTITFMKHNLGADQTANPLTPSWRLNGDYYQWGRPTKAANGPSDGTGGGDAVNGVWNTTPASSTSWSDASKTSNDPCPSGFRVPTKNEWQCVVSQNYKENFGWSGFWSSWSNTNYNTGILIGTGSSQIFLPTPGLRDYRNGVGVFRGASGYYWSSTSTTGVKEDTYYLQIGSGASASVSTHRELTEGLSVRCIAE